MTVALTFPYFDDGRNLEKTGSIILEQKHRTLYMPCRSGLFVKDIVLNRNGFSKFYLNNPQSLCMGKESPEAISLATLGRSDSKRPEKTCHGLNITTGKPCRKPLKKDGGERYCHIHRDQQFAQPRPPLSWAKVNSPGPPNSSTSRAPHSKTKTSGRLLGWVIRILLCHSSATARPKERANVPSAQAMPTCNRSGVLKSPRPPTKTDCSLSTAPPPQTGRSQPPTTRLHRPLLRSTQAHRKVPKFSRPSAALASGPNTAILVPGADGLGAYIRCEGKFPSSTRLLLTLKIG